MFKFAQQMYEFFSIKKYYFLLFCGMFNIPVIVFGILVRLIKRTNES
jgi:hypothetical protein